MPLGPLSHSWHPAWVGPLQHAWGGGSCPMLPRSSIDTAVLCLGFSALWAQRALDCIETKNKQINKTKGERQTKRAGSMAGFSICLERSAFGLWNDSTRHRLPTHVANEKFESKRPARHYYGDRKYTRQRSVHQITAPSVVITEIWRTSHVAFSASQLLK